MEFEININLYQLNLTQLAELAKIIHKTPIIGYSGANMRDIVRIMIVNAGIDETKSALKKVGFKKSYIDFIVI